MKSNFFEIFWFCLSVAWCLCFYFFEADFRCLLQFSSGFDTCLKQTLLVFETTKNALESQDLFFAASKAPETPSKSIQLTYYKLYNNCTLSLLQNIFRILWYCQTYHFKTLLNYKDALIALCWLYRPMTWPLIWGWALIWTGALNNSLR